MYNGSYNKVLNKKKIKKKPQQIDVFLSLINKYNKSKKKKTI